MVVNRVAAMNKTKPAQLSSPSIPATAPVKHAEMNLTVSRVELATIFGW